MHLKRKIGVLTFHRCINYGSYWQARCLVEGLRARGHDALLIDHDSWKINVSEWKCGFQPVLPAPVPKKDYFHYGLKMCRFFRAFSSLPSTSRFVLEKPADMERFDLVIVGSDEVWNLRHPWYGRCALFFGDGVRAKRLASYAASFGSYDVSEGLEPVWVDKLREFSSISVRDENSRSIIRNALGFEPELVLDPCLQFSPQPEGSWREPRQPYVAVYGHTFSDTFGREVRRWAESRGFKLVSIGYRNDWADAQWLTADPHNFAHFIAGAEAVATNFFHGCVFALRNAKPFACEITSYRYHKTSGLMAILGGERHLVTENTPSAGYDACLSEPVDPEIYRRIDGFRRTSEAYLDTVLA